MKAFRFRLERVLDWRARQAEIEELKLQGLIGERERIRARGEALEREREEAGRAVVGAASPGYEELTALSRFQRYVLAERARLAEATRDCERRISTQRAQLVEAQRKQQLLERLRTRRRAEWQVAFDREQEDLAAELYLAKLAAQKETAPAGSPLGRR